jgi:DNA-binding phage protein
VLDSIPAVGNIMGAMNFETAQKRLAKTPLKVLKTIGQETGIPWQTLYKIARNETGNPRVKTVEALAKYYEKR